MGFADRRKRLMSSLKRPLLLWSGGPISRNYPHNLFPYRADSTFMYFFERPEPNSAALFDPATGKVTLYLPERTLDDAVWHGELATFEAERARHDVDAVRPVERLEDALKALKLDTLAVSDARTTRRARALTGADLDFDDPLKVGPLEVLESIASMRLRKDSAELAQMRETARITLAAHVEAMKDSAPGVHEQELAGIVDGIFSTVGCVPAYGTILSVRGEILHARGHDNVLQAGDIVLLDAGCEAPSGYCSDVTRCWPVGGPFTAEGGDVYDTVLQANLDAIAAVKPGVRYRDVHRIACRTVADGLAQMGLLKGSPDALVESGAHAVFFPHGVGHPIGLDVHDLEAFGDHVLYPGGRTRSTQFGTRYLRMDLDLAEGMTFTIEPGVYFVPQIIRSAALRAQFADQVNWSLAEKFLGLNGGRGFGGIRIEDDVLCTASGAEVLTVAIPKARAEVEALPLLAS
ncbi:MAG: aminopeptidase P family protein [Myxococcaceae bacterium]|nr:aminopeptidase P family protein [Myxococcaceae bacterium]